MKPKKVYKAAKGAPFKKQDTAKIGQRLDRLEAQSRGRGVTPEMVVEDAKDQSSPLHPYFIWDDTKAARAFRIAQARSIINHFEIIIVSDDGDRMEAKAWHSVRLVSDDGKSAMRSYASLATVQNEKLLRDQVIAQAIKELEYWKMRYGQYEELFEITEAIEKTAKHRRSSKAG